MKTAVLFALALVLTLICSPWAVALTPDPLPIAAPDPLPVDVLIETADCPGGVCSAGGAVAHSPRPFLAPRVAGRVVERFQAFRERRPVRAVLGGLRNRLIPWRK